MAFRTSTTNGSDVPSRSGSLVEGENNQQLAASGSIMAAKSRGRTRSRIPSSVAPIKNNDIDVNKKSVPSNTTKSPPCSVPIAVLFVVTCIFVALVFTVVTLVSSLALTNEVVSSVESSLATSLQGAMKYVTDPLLKSQQYVMQLKEMIELRPETYACDDSIVQFPGNSSTVNFLFQIGLYGLHRKDLYNVFQSRVSKRFLKPDGTGPAGICCAVSPGRGLLQLYLNNTQVLDRNTNGSYFSTLSTQPGTSLRTIDVTTLALYRGAVRTTTSGWMSDSIAPSVTGLAGPANKYSFFAHINNPSDPSEIWAVGIDHNMVDLKSTLLQATPPITVGQTTTPSQVSGAHTTMYDLNEGLVMASTHPDVPVASTYGLLYPSGASPSADVNNAYQTALDKCGATGCTDAVVTIGKTHVHTAYRIYIPSASLHLLMVSSVPRHFFFASADNAFAVSLGLSASCCIVIIAGCIALLVMLHRPLSSLKDNMLLAAELQNDRVVYTYSYLRDIAALSAVFDGMNKQLLIARSFVPEAVLLNRTNDAFDDEEEGSVVDDKSVSKSTVLMESEGTKVKNLADSASSSHTSIFSISQLKTATSTVEKRIGVLSLNLVGFHTLCTPERNTTRSGKVQELSTALLSLAVKCAHSEKGVMDSFHGDHFILTFNASRAVAGPLAAAVRAANAFIDEVQSRALFADSPGVAAGAASGRAQVGTLGIDGYRRLSVVGDVYKNANALQLAAVQFLRMNRDITPVGCMVHESSIKELGSCSFRLQAVGCLQSANHRAMSKEAPPTNIGYFALPIGAAVTGGGADEEWLYEVDVIESSNPFHEPNRAMLSLILGDVAECGRILDTNAFKDAAHASLDVSESNESVLIDIEVNESPANQAWELVRHYYRHATSSANGAASVPIAIAALARQCTLPWVLFHQ